MFYKKTAKLKEFEEVDNMSMEDAINILNQLRLNFGDFKVPSNYDEEVPREDFNNYKYFYALKKVIKEYRMGEWK